MTNLQQQNVNRKKYDFFWMDVSIIINQEEHSLKMQCKAMQNK